MNTVNSQSEGGIHFLYLETNGSATLSRQLLFRRSQGSFYANKREISGDFVIPTFQDTQMQSNASKNWIITQEINIYPDTICPYL